MRFRICSLLLSLGFPWATLALPASTDNPFLPIPIDGPPPPEPPEVIARDERGRATLRAVRIETPLRMDGFLEESVYGSVPAASDFIQQEPIEGQPATEKTEIWVLFDEKNVYVSARCWDSHPENIVANEMRRDNFNIFLNDNFAVILDTFYDRRNGFLFHTNPVGGLFDGYVTDERETNRDWNTVYQSVSRRFQDGWTVEMAIPFKSLRYKAGTSQIWGINFRRIVRSKNEHSYLTRIPAAYGQRGITNLSSAATLVGVEPPAQSKNLELKPYAVSGVTTDRAADPPVESDLDVDAGFDLKYGLTRSLIFDFTYNTDFAQVEEDEVQVNLTRFSLFFPEKRDFFLEGQGIFTFGGASAGGRGGGGGGGGGGDQSNTPVIFFSRRIGLADETKVPIDAGARLTGKAGPYSIGVLAIGTAEAPAEGVLATNFSVVRLKRDVLRRSNIGVIGTRRSPSVAGFGTNEVYGLDANFNFLANSAVTAYYAKSSTDGRSGSDASYRGRVDLNGDRYGLEAEYLLAGENFNPEIGFLRREDFRRSFAQFRFSPRPKSLRGVRKLGWEGSFEYITDGQGRLLESREAQARFNVDFESSDQFVVEYSRNYEFLDEPFEIETGVVIPVGGYDFQDVRASYQMGPQRKLSGRLSFRRGSFYDGERTEAAYFGRAEISPRLTLEPRLSWNWVDLPEGRFTTKLASARVNFSLSPRVFVGALLQYLSSDDSLSTNVRFRWEYQPGSDLFVVYTDGRDTEGTGFPLLQNRSLVLKLTRLFRF